MIVDTNVFTVSGGTDLGLRVAATVLNPEYVSYRTALGRYETRKRVARSYGYVARRAA